MHHRISYFICHKPFGMLTQFSGEEGDYTLKDLEMDFPKDVYPVGRLDKDSEGLLLLTNNKRINDKLLNPKNKHEKEYWVQVEGDIDAVSIKRMCRGVMIKVNGRSYQTAPAKCEKLDLPDFPERTPPIRYRKSIPTSWISLTITEGKNRQVRKMTAAVGFPTLRLIRKRIVDLELEDLKVGEVRQIPGNVLNKKLFS